MSPVPERNDLADAQADLATLKAAARAYIKLEKNWRTDSETGMVAWWEKKQDALDALAALVGAE